MRSVLQQFYIILVEWYILYEAWWNRYRGRVVSGECLWVLVWPQIQRYLFMWLYNNDSKTRQPLIPRLATTFHTLLNTISYQTQRYKGCFAKNMYLLYTLYIIYFMFSDIATWKDELTAQLWICVSPRHVNLSIWVWHGNEYNYLHIHLQRKKCTSIFFYVEMLQYTFKQ